MMSMSSTLVETVSIDYEDFNETYLTCGTCLCMYDGGEHTPKLLHCSHTVCLECLDRIVATFARDTGQFRCPICRELISIPRGGVRAMPPSFLVNQLLDLMARQRREVIPKCSTHQTQELLFCETCDIVFCTLCTGGSHMRDDDDAGGEKGSPSKKVSSSTLDHTVIPFSIAIKRMSEILIYKANECKAKLNDANDIVNEEIHRLDHNADSAFETVNARFQTVLDNVERRRQEVLAEVREKRDEKKKVLEEQLQIIQGEKQKVDQDVQQSQHQVEVRNITKKISDLNCKLDTVSTLSEPRENSYIEYRLSCSSDDVDHVVDPVLGGIASNLSQLGSIKTSKTFPSLCRATLETTIAHLEAVARVTTIDYNGVFQERGGDPVAAELMDDVGEKVPTEIVDRNDGTYEVKFTAHKAATFCLKIMIFSRPIKDCPLFIEVTEHNPPLISFGARGTKDKGFMQPCNVAVDGRNNVFVVDTGNSRIKRLSPNLDFEEHITNEGLEGRSVTGVCMGSTSDSLMAINWRTKTVTEISYDGNTIGSFTHDDFKEPIDIAVDKEDRVVVADNGLSAVLVFDPSGKLLKTIDGGSGSADHKSGRKVQKGSNKGTSVGFKDISAVCVAPSGEYVVADYRIQVFTPDGVYVREIGKGGVGSKGGRFGGLCCDSNGFLMATRTEKGRSFIQVFRYETGELYSTIDSHGCKMKRPTGLAVMGAGDEEGGSGRHHVVVVDIGNDCVRKFRYF